jgi:hypothetical protein
MVHAACHAGPAGAHGVRFIRMERGATLYPSRHGAHVNGAQRRARFERILDLDPRARSGNLRSDGGA